MNPHERANEFDHIPVSCFVRGVGREMPRLFALAPRKRGEGEGEGPAALRRSSACPAGLIQRYLVSQVSATLLRAHATSGGFPSPCPLPQAGEGDGKEPEPDARPDFVGILQPRPSPA